MMLTLLWKEFREHWSIWLTMVVMTGLLSLGIAQIPGIQDPSGQVGLAVLALAGVYGVVCGSMMFAGEREGGTLTFLDIFLGRRDLLWLGKFAVGVVLVVTEALAVALTLHWADQPPPTWLPAVMGQWDRHFIDMGPAGAVTTRMWFTVLAFVTFEGFAWGMLGSTMTQRVLTSAGVALLMGFPVWWITVLFPAPASLVVRTVVILGLLAGSLFRFLLQARDTVMAPPPLLADPKAAVMRELERERETARRQPAAKRRREPDGWSEPLPVTLAPESYSIDVDDRPRPRRRFARPDEARSPREVLLWLTFGQAGLPLAILAIASAFLGLFIPSFGQVLWPMATLLLGVACGAATFAFEQSDLSYQFLAAQRFPLPLIWNVKIFFWAAAAALAAVLLAAVGVLALALSQAGNAGGLAPFRFGSLFDLMGPVLFFGVWLAYGFGVGQVFVLLCRKPIYAVMIATMVSLGAIGLWLPALLCRGMGGWQLWATPIAALVATRLLVRAWAAGRIQERLPMAALLGFGAAALAWLAVHIGWRVWEVPGVGEPLDRAAFRASIPTGDDNVAALKIQEALAQFDAPDGKEAPWLARMREAALLPPGVLETPSSEGSPALLRHLGVCQRMAGNLSLKARGAAAAGRHEAALDYLTQILALSRNLRNKASVVAYAAGVEIEEVALIGLDDLLRRGKPTAQLVRQIQAALDRHAAETPAALDCLRTECYRAGGLLERPTGWTFYNGAIPERWLAGSIALSLDTPWERERAVRIWRLVWAGHFRAVQTPHWQLPDSPTLSKDVLAGWLPATTGPDASMSRERLSRLLQDSWLADSQLYCSVPHLQAAANRARWQVDAGRLAAALMSYQLREGKPAARLDDLVPKDIPELPVDPYSGQSFHYRISEGEELAVLQGNMGFPRPREVGAKIGPGEGILWSTGPDRVDDGGRRQGNRLQINSDDALRAGYDLITRIPRWR